MRASANLLLEDGFFMKGKLVGIVGTTGGEICFNTGMTGYQEIYTDPSYTGQIVVTTHSHIGNYGFLNCESESKVASVSGVIINQLSTYPSRAKSEGTLQLFFEKNNIVGISDVDTRMLVRHIRAKGVMNAVISSELTKSEMQIALEKLPSMVGAELSSKICTQQAILFGDSTSLLRISILDLGIKKSIIDNLVQRGFYCKVFPAKSTYQELKSFNPDGFFISNGPGDPSSMDYAVDTIKEIINHNEILFGICLGHQLIARACGISTIKMHHGHRGLNHPVINLDTGKSEITTQNHGFVISSDEAQNNSSVKVTHKHLNDDSIAGIKLNNRNIFSVQYHPEASPGPHDSRYIFDEFVNKIKEKNN